MASSDFRHQLLARVFQYVLGFRGETDDDLRALAARQLGKNVGGRLQFQRHRALALDLLLRRALGTIVGHGSGLDHDGRFGQQLQDRLAHLLGGFDTARLRRRPGGVRAVGPLTSSTRAPRRNAASASAYPMRPLERLVR